LIKATGRRGGKSFAGDTATSSASAGKQLIEDPVTRARKGKITVLFGVRDAERSNAALIAELITEMKAG